MRKRVLISPRRVLVLLSLAFLWLGQRPLVAANGPDNVLLDFTAKWCGPCREMSPIVSRLERENLPVLKVDIDEQPNLAQKYQIKSIPCFVLVANGREINRIVGPTSEQTLRQMVKMLPRNEPRTNTAPNSPSQGKPQPKAAQQFAKNPESRLTPTSDMESIRGQNPDSEQITDPSIAEPLAASTRIRVKDGSKVHFGSGTIIDSQDDRSIILTCGHIFRGMSREAVVEVDVYSNPKARPQTIIGKVVRSDLGSDLGVVEISPKRKLPFVRLATSSESLVVKDKVCSIGCGGGDRPTIQNHQITSINKYNGTENIECSGAPQQGRSGGGLFHNSQLVAVCVAAEPKDQRGIYHSMKPIAHILAKANLGRLVNPTQLNSPASSEDFPVREEIAANDLAAESLVAMGGGDELSGIPSELLQGAEGNSADYVGAEIVCIVRPKTPGTMSRVVIVNQASSRFVSDLLHESGSRAAETAATAPKGSNRAKSVTRPAAANAKASSQMAMQKPRIEEKSTIDEPETFETSFEPQRYRRHRD